MKAVVIYSKTGNTRSVAERLVGPSCPLLEVKPRVDDPNIQNPELKEIPDLSTYDHVVLGSPVHGFMLSKVMNAYILKTDFTGKTVDLFVTHFFPFAWMGGNQTLKQMKKLVEKKGGTVNLLTSINWKNKKRTTDIDSLVERYTA